MNLFLAEIKDKWVRDNFRKLLDWIRGTPILKGEFRFLEITFTAAVTARDYKHNLPFTPTDVILLATSGGATVTFHYDSFTPTYINLTTSAATTIRCFIGRYEEN
jgi:hypothetical protein